MTKKQKGVQMDKQIDSALKIIMDASPVGIVVFGSDARIIYGNSLASKLFGKRATEIFGFSCGDLIDCPKRHDRPQACGQTKSCEKCSLFYAICTALSDEPKEAAQEGEALLERDPGLTAIWVRYKVGSIVIKGSRVAIVTVDDITGYKQAEEELRKTRERFRSFFENAAVAVAIVDQDGHVVEANEMDCRFLGYPRSELVGMHFAQFTHPEDLLLDVDFYKSLQKGQRQRYEMDKRYIRKDGEVVWGHLSVSLIPENQGSPKFTMVVCEDITERKRIEEALRESESTVRKKLKAILEPDGNLGTLNLADIIDSDLLQSMMEDFYRITNISSAIIDLSGKILVSVGRQDVCAKFHRVHPDTLKNCIESDIILSNDVKAGTYKTYRCKNNMWDMATPIELDGRHLGNIFLGQFFYENEIPDYDLFRNQARQCGFDEKEYLAAIDRVPIWSHETVNSAMAFCAKLAKMISTLSYNTIRFSRVLSQQEETLHKLSESEERLRLARMATNDVIWDWDIVNDSQQWNASGAGVFGWTDIVQHPQTAGWWVKRVHPKDRQRIEEGFFAVVDNPARNHWQDEYRFQKADGSYAQVMDRGYVLRNSQGKAIRMIGAMLDITERIEAENVIRESEQKYRTLFEESLNPIMMVDENARFIDSNKAALEFLECDREELLNRGVWDFVPPDKVDIVKQDHAPFISRRMIETEYFVRGTIKTLMLNVVPFEIKEKTILYGIGQDITERKRFEEALQKKSEELERFFISSLDMICISNTNGEFIRLNPEWEKVLGYSLSELEGFNFQKFIHPDDMNVTLNAIAKLEAQEKVLNFENRYRCKDGSYRWIEWRSIPHGKQIYSSARDITERKQHEEMIKSSLREKETLLKEVHHRVKNNMQVISSLLNLQIMKNKDKQVNQALMDCRGRINSMASVHEMLYASNSLSVIDCHQYFSKLTGDILYSYHPSFHRVKLTVDAKGVTLGIQQALPLGLMINEMLSNSLKYGFPENMHGQIMIRLMACEQDMFEFVFSDNGIGIPEYIDWRNTKSLGLNLIVLLAENQLRGTVSLDRAKGTCFTTKFRCEEI